MRIGTFLLGGIAGAAAVIYLNRKSKSMLFSAFSSSSDSMGKMVNKAKDTMTGANDSTSFNTNSTKDLGDVEQIIKKDPDLQHTVNEILIDNKENTTTIQ
jgi:hypothetical protein